jgi:dihydropteroate synthase
MNQLYIRPLGLLWGEDADAAVSEAQAGRIAGGLAAFALAELISREGRQVKREIRHYRDVADSHDRFLRRRLELIEEPRAAVAGVSLSRPSVIGIINVTPDSFSDGGESATEAEAVARGLRLTKAGASIIDVGGESTRPGSLGVSLEEERKRVIPVVRALAEQGLAVSIDTRKAQIMREAVEAGAQMINDVSAMRFDAQARATAAELRRPLCLMHARGEPKTMQIDPVYEDVLLDVFDELEGFIKEGEKAGMPRRLMLADPGIGFGKTYRHNLEIIKGLSLYHGLGVGIVFGASRKSFIGALTGEKAGRERAPGSVAAALAAAAQGVQILRVHDVKETAQALRVWSAAVEPARSGL